MSDGTEPPTGPSASPEPAGGRQKRSRARTAFSSGGWVRRSARLWGFLGFILLVLVLARSVILPFVFALLLVYILAPVVQRMSVRMDGSKRMPKGLAIVACYLVLLSIIGLFVGVLVPRLSKDAARIGREAPHVYERFNTVWAPQAARWLERRFPSIAPPSRAEQAPPLIEDVPLPPGTTFVMTPLPDGRLAVQLQPGGVEIGKHADGSFTITPREQPREQLRTEDKIRAWAQTMFKGIRAEGGDFFRFGQALIGGVARGVFTFFLVLMVAAFILLDLEKIHVFVRSLFPRQFHGDYDIIVAGMNRGLSGVIRGQLFICLVNGIFTYIGLQIFAVKYPLILAVVAAVLSLIPIFGSILSSLPIMLAAMVSTDQGVEFFKPLAMLAWIVGIHFVEANFLNPKIIGTAAKIHPVLVIFALIVGEHSYGLTGALLAVPVLSIIQVLFLFFRDKTWIPDRLDSGGQAVVQADPAEP